MAYEVLFLIGSSANIGASTVKTVLAAGYLVAQAPRSAQPENSTPENLHVVLDITKPETVTKAFEVVRQKFGEANVVVFNAASYHNGGREDTLFHVFIDEFATVLTANVTSAFVAAREAVTSFCRIASSFESSSSSSCSPSS